MFITPTAVLDEEALCIVYSAIGPTAASKKKKKMYRHQLRLTGGKGSQSSVPLVPPMCIRHSRYLSPYLSTLGNG